MCVCDCKCMAPSVPREFLHVNGASGGMDRYVGGAVRCVCVACIICELCVKMCL